MPDRHLALSLTGRAEPPNPTRPCPQRTLAALTSRDDFVVESGSDNDHDLLS